MNLELVNVVAGGDLGVSIDLHSLSSNLAQYSPNYEPEVSPGLHFKLPDTGVTVMIFGTGKYHLTGGKSIEQIKKANAEVIKIIEETLLIEIDESDPDVRNLVFRGKFDREFDLSELASDLPDAAEYPKNNQPGLKYRSEEFPGLIRIFRTGSFTLTGVKGEKEAQGLIEEFHSRLCKLMTE